jgi:hypothetical protein
VPESAVATRAARSDERLQVEPLPMLVRRGRMSCQMKEIQ